MFPLEYGSGEEKLGLLQEEEVLTIIHFLGLGFFSLSFSTQNETNQQY
jgi:hypothetical protein